MYNKKELDKKIDDIFEDTDIIFKLAKLKLFVWDYANECFNDGCNFEVENGSE